jgi:hypothetical protein
MSGVRGNQALNIDELHQAQECEAILGRGVQVQSLEEKAWKLF